MSAVEVSNKLTSNGVQVVAKSDDGDTVTQTITDGESILVGSDDQCRMRLPDTSVSPKHCLIRFQNSEVTLQDWCSESGTHLNGAPIDGVSAVSPNDRVRLGVYELTFARPGSEISPTPATKAPAAKARVSLTPSTLESRTPESISKDDSRASAAADAGSPEPTSEYRHRLGDASDHAASSEPQTEDKLADASSSDPARESITPSAPPVQNLAAKPRTMRSPAAAPRSPRKANNNPSVEQGTIDLLTSEIELLQAELLEKDAQINQLSEGSGESRDDDSKASNLDLDQRIERLLFELDQSDQRVEALEEISRLGEETQMAEAEEKRQLESWVNDIEQRIAEREEESQAECEVLRQRLERAAEERGHLHQQVDQLAQSDGAGDPALEEMVQTLRQEIQAVRQENDSLREKIDEGDAAYDQQKKRSEKLEQQAEGGGVQYIQQNVDEATREERLLLAQERAALSRQKLELTNKVEEITRDVDRESRVHPADEKFRVFREQLKELHKEEKSEYVAPTMSQRLSRLWQRLDGPTDRD